MGDESGHDLPALRAQAEDILGQLQALQQQIGTYLEQLAAVEWAALAEQGMLAGVPKFLIERTITDARHVLASGQQVLGEVLDPGQEPVDDLSERLQAIIRLYTDTPEDMRTRCQRLTAWLAKIDAALQQDGQQPLTARIVPPQL